MQISFENLIFVKSRKLLSVDNRVVNDDNQVHQLAPRSTIYTDVYLKRGTQD